MTLDGKIRAIFNEKENRSLPVMVLDLFESQRQSWRLFSENHAGLKDVETRVLLCNGSRGKYDVTVQWNPGRITSTAARLDEENRADRSCFLCIENLPEAQKGILYRERFLILCNPMPIFDRHLTISSVQHVAQMLEGSVEDFFLLAQDLAPDFVVFYNGARCGASAPHHLHFQACPESALPELAKDHRLYPERKIGGSRLAIIAGSGCGLVMITGSSVKDLTEVLDGVLKAFQAHFAVTEEPMVNMICSYHEAQWRLFIYPRKRHRPDIFYAQDGQGLLVSPGAVDMAGVIIAPVHEHFMRITPGHVESIYQDVALDETLLEEIIKI